VESFKASTYGDLKSPPSYPPDADFVLDGLTDKEFLFEKKKTDNYQDQLLIELIPIFRKYDFLPKSAFNSCCNRLLDHIYPKCIKPNAHMNYERKS
tara:strand:+ start:470 stop:757 length:288 start_codon:yes stop_codon:yes gene_type:complete